MTAHVVPLRPLRKRLTDLHAAQQAALLGQDVRFWRFLAERRGILVLDEDQARRAIYELCQISSRRELEPGSVAAAIWHELVADFDLWKTGLG